MGPSQSPRKPMLTPLDEPRRLYREIADQLRARMAAGEFVVGGRLPSERDLALQLGVPRPSVREALIVLEVEGLVEMRAGLGVYVIGWQPMGARGVLGDTFGPFEIIRARQLVEGELAAVAARQMSAEQVSGLQEALDLMDADAARGRVPLRGDRLFHLRIAQAADNGPLLRAVMQWFDERNNPLFEPLGQHFENEHNWAAAMAEHGRVIEAIAAGAPQRARAAMQVHLQRSHDRFAAAWPHSAEPPEPADAEVAAMARSSI
jgi:GntR family transcriptional regulator, transcriptional repressor for pyruvate dehydrogenase complex